MIVRHWPLIIVLSTLFLLVMRGSWLAGKDAGKRDVAANEVFVPIADGLAITLRATDTGVDIYFGGKKFIRTHEEGGYLDDVKEGENP